jgi:hypothetical protein
LIDKSHPDYDERYRRLFHQEEFANESASPEPTRAPGLATKAANFAKAVITHAVAGVPRGEG